MDTGSNITIIPQEKVCDFVSHCPDMSDEKSCPRDLSFEQCEELTDSPSCNFVEDPVDNLDWVIATGKGEMCEERVRISKRKRQMSSVLFGSFCRELWFDLGF